MVTDDELSSAVGVLRLALSESKAKRVKQHLSSDTHLQDIARVHRAVKEMDIGIEHLGIDIEHLKSKLFILKDYVPGACCITVNIPTREYIRPVADMVIDAITNNNNDFDVQIEFCVPDDEL